MRTLNPIQYAAQENKILDAARRLFAEKGYKETGMKDIAASQSTHEKRIKPRAQTKMKNVSATRATSGHPTLSGLLIRRKPSLRT